MHVMKNAFELFSEFEDSAQEEQWSSNMCCSLFTEFIYLVTLLIFYTVSETGSKESLHGITVHTDI